MSVTIDTNERDVAKKAGGGHADFPVKKRAAGKRCTDVIADVVGSNPVCFQSEDSMLLKTPIAHSYLINSVTSYQETWLMARKS